MMSSNRGLIDERQAENWIIRNNYDLQCLFENSEVKQALKEAYLAGLNERLTEDIIRDEVDAIMEDDLLCSYKDILL